MWKNFHSWRRGLISELAFWVFRLMALTWRVRHVNFPSEVAGPVVYGHFHGDEILLIKAYWHRGMGVMASLSKDGELQARLLTRLGYRVVRGSSSKGGAAGLKALTDLAREELCSTSLAVDGPRGPIYKVKPGVLKLAQLTGCPLVVGAAAASRRYIFKKAWNRCFLPLPFSRNVVVYAPPFFVSKDITESEFEKLRFTIEEKLVSLKQQAEGQFHRKFDGV